MRTRFAPAPTGYLHLGHVANALTVWGEARARGAEVLLRIEDHDRQRCRPGYEAALLEDLEWLGFVPDLAPPAVFRRGPTPYRQSDNGPAYLAALAQLEAAGHRVYACDCSRQDVMARAPAVVSADIEVPYDGYCRDRGLSHGPGRATRVLLRPGVVRFHDLRLGTQHQEPAAQCGDLMLRDRLGNWTYQFAVVTDDRDQGVDLVIRGMDLLPSTGRQFALAAMLGRGTPPGVLHHPLVRTAGGRKLSKADRDAGIRDLRGAGWTPERVLGAALHALGTHGGGPLPLQEALNLFSSPV
jgi:glutamyl/glutaminyl-tRNA synthetase